MIDMMSKIWKVWTRFWFTPVEPTTLGFIRVVTGIVIVYTHLVYCFDLQGFFGPKAWYDLESINRERQEYPIVTPDFDSWDDFKLSVKVPSQPHRRKAVMDWMKNLPSNADRRTQVIAFLKELDAIGDFDTARATMSYVMTLRSDPDGRKAQLDALVAENLRSPLDMIPNQLKNLPETGLRSRTDIRKRIDVFFATLPVSDDDRNYILNYFVEMDPGSRLELINFLSRLSMDAKERDAEIEYLAYWGFERNKTTRVGHPIYSLWFHVTGPIEMPIAHGAIIVIMVMFTLGLWTRVTSFLTWFFAINYIHRDFYVLFGMDTMSNILLIYLMIGKSGGALSLDRLIDRYRAAKSSLKKHGRIDAETAAFLKQPPPSLSTGLATRLLQVHFCFIYMAAGMSKLKGASWWGHTAYWDTMANPEFTMICYEWYEGSLRMLLQSRFLYSVTAAIAIAHTFIAELGLPFLVWTRLRPYILIIGMLLHAGIAIFMGLSIFSLLMMLMLVIYIPSAAIRSRLMSPSGKKRIVQFNPNDDHHIAYAARAIAIDSESSVDAQSVVNLKQSKLVVNGNDVPDAVPELISSSIFFHSFAWIPGVTGVMRLWLRS
jgi:hypothetical protein